MFWHADWSLRSNERMMGEILSALFSVSDTNFSLEIDGAIWSCEEKNFGSSRIKLHLLYLTSITNPFRSKKK